MNQNESRNEGEVNRKRKRTSRSSTDGTEGSSSTLRHARPNKVAKLNAKASVCGQTNCGPCVVCQRPPCGNSQWFHIKTMKKQELIDLLKFECDGIDDISCICNACRKIYCNKLKDATYTPTKTRQKIRPSCFLSKIDLCDQVSSAETTAPTPDEIASIFSIPPGVRESILIESTTIHLCTNHYSTLYKCKCLTLCNACNSVIKGYQRRYLCTNLDLVKINHKLGQVMDDVRLGVESILCQTCYFCAVKHTERTTLADILLDLESFEFTDLSEEETLHHKALVETSIYLCNLFIRDEGILAIELHEMYEDKLSTISKVHCSGKYLNIQARKIKWFLSGLKQIFGNLLISKTCDAKNHSRILVYKNCDLLKALHASYFQQRVQKRSHARSKASTSPEVPSSQQGTNFLSVGKELNYRLKIQAKGNQAHFIRNPLDVDSINIFNLMSEHTDPVLWNLLSLLTMNHREETTLPDHFSATEHIVFGDLNDDNAKERFNRRLILMFMIQFVMNDHNNYPFHVIHTGIIKQYSNCPKLVELFNQSGWCVGMKTYDRFLGEVVTNKAVIPKTLCEGALTMATFDNVDVKNDFQAVTVDSNETVGRSWHGTSVMAQQPLPSERLHSLELLSRRAVFCVIQTYGCGRCFYRCVAILGCSVLLKSARTVVGSPQESNLRNLESDVADRVRKVLTDFMSENIQAFNKLSDLVKNNLLENRDGEFDDSFETRIARNYQTSTFAGVLELTIAAFVLKTQVHVYQLSSCNYYKRIAVYPGNYFTCAVPLRLLYTHDSNGNPGHFNILVTDEVIESRDLFDLDSDPKLLFSKWTEHNLSMDPNPPNVTLDEVFCNDCDRVYGDDESFSDVQAAGSVPTPVIKSSLQTRKPFRQLFTFRKEKSNFVPGKTDFVQPLYKTFLRHQLSMDVFRPSVNEIYQSACLFNKILLYVLQRFTKIEKELPVLLPTMKCKFSLEQSPRCTKSKCAYLSILDEKADSVATVKIVLHDLFTRFQISKKVNHMFVIGDMKTFEYIMKVKLELGSTMDWVIPYPGDWHVLKNFQEVLMKIYWDAGLKDLAKVSHAGSLSSLQTCGNFTKTHRFLMQSYEAIYMLQLKMFLAQRKQEDQESSMSNNEILSTVEEVLKRMTGASFSDTKLFIDAQKQLESVLFPFLHEELNAYCSTMSNQYKTFAFWDRFLKNDMFAYIEFYISLRSRNWHGRLAAVKKMCELFHAFDRYNYSKWLSVHLSQIFGLPDHVVKHLENGAFASSITGINYSCVGLDEWHEMGINKHVKSIIVRNTPADISSSVHTLEYVAKMVHHYGEQVGHKSQTEKNGSQRDLSPAVIIADHNNILAYYKKIQDSEMFSQSNERLFHAFTNAEATAAVENDLTSYAEIGKKSFENFVESRILKKTSVKNTVLKKHRLKTFTVKPCSKRRISSMEKERKLITKCFKRTINVLSQGGSLDSQVLQYMETPRAICTVNNTPVTGRKCTIYNMFQKRYEDYSILNEWLPSPQTNWCIILEGMNLIYKEPRGLKTFSELAARIMNEWILPYFRAGYKEVRFLFDQMETQGLSPKTIEQERRDQSDDITPTLATIHDDTPLPSLSSRKSWTNFLKNRHNKHRLCIYLFNSLLKFIQPKLVGTDKVCVLSGGFHKVLKIDGPVTVIADSSGVSPFHFQCNHEESDTQIWLHVQDTRCRNILVRSVDRDIAMVGLPFMPRFIDKNVYIQYDSSKSGKYLHMNVLQKAINDDDKLSGIDISIRCSVIQTLYITSGCDFVSYWKEKGKATFFTALYNYANFVNSGASTIAHTQLSPETEGLFAFYRLVGCVFFNANRVSLNDFDTPIELFNSFSRSSAIDRHTLFLDKIRKASWQGTYEHELLPSLDALQFHWKRSCWVSSVWCQSLDAEFDYPQITRCGWEVDNDGKISVTWDTVENMTRVRENIVFLTQGCGCKSEKNKCLKGHCKCFKSGKKCGPGCSCKYCGNCYQSPEVDNNDQTVNTDVNDVHVANDNVNNGGNTMVTEVLHDVDPILANVNNFEMESNYSSDSDDLALNSEDSDDLDSDTPIDVDESPVGVTGKDSDSALSDDENQ